MNRHNGTLGIFWRWWNCVSNDEAGDDCRLACKLTEIYCKDNERRPCSYMPYLVYLLSLATMNKTYRATKDSCCETEIIPIHLRNLLDKCLTPRKTMFDPEQADNFWR